MSDTPASLQPPTPPAARNLRIIQALTVVIIILAAAGTIWLQGQGELLRRIGQSPFALPALFLASVMLNPLAVGIVAGIGQTLGEITGYLAGYSGQGLVNRSKTYERVEGWMKRNELMGELVVFVLALIPNPLFDAAGMAAGALHFPAWKYLLAAGFGKVIKNVIFAYGGSLSIDWLSRFFGN
jgi:uncharacterized membrane protein YdjX (TVP38/TMEM64 family)